MNFCKLFRAFALLFLLFGFNVRLSVAEIVSPAALVKNILQDQKAIITSPLRADRADAWLWIPTAALTTSLAIRWNTRQSVDERIASNFANPSGTNQSIMNGVTQLGNGAVPFGLAVAGYGWGYWQSNDRLTGFSARWFEALADASIWSEMVKVLAGRTRPDSAPFRSEFLGPSGFIHNTGANSSFVSGHSILAFTSAAVVSREFPTPWVIVPSYMLAGGVGFSRIYLEKHWLSDVIVGAAMGHSIGMLVENRHHPGSPTAGRWQPWVDGDTLGIVWQKTF